ncbi:uncharacterized protein [Epargyreus clarus]
MSGDSQHQPEKKEEGSERELLVPEGRKLPVALAGASAAVDAVEPAVVSLPPEEKQELIDTDKSKEENKDSSGDSPSNDKKNDSDYLEHNETADKSTECKWEENGEKGDNVDSVYLRPPPAHKARSNASTPPAEEEDCGIKCLYYTLQCCDCVLM